MRRPHSCTPFVIPWYEKGRLGRALRYFSSVYASWLGVWIERKDYVCWEGVGRSESSRGKAIRNRREVVTRVQRLNIVSVAAVEPFKRTLGCCLALAVRTEYAGGNTRDTLVPWTRIVLRPPLGRSAASHQSVVGGEADAASVDLRPLKVVRGERRLWRSIEEGLDACM